MSFRITENRRPHAHSVSEVAAPDAMHAARTNAFQRTWGDGTPIGLVRARW